jgi:hypothetical protein
MIDFMIIMISLYFINLLFFLLFVRGWILIRFFIFLFASIIFHWLGISFLIFTVLMIYGYFYCL